MTPRPRLRLAAALGLAIATGACGGHDYEPPPEEERVAEALALYDAARFDTVAWSSDQERIEAGNLVYADDCRRCHGALGNGGTDYASQHDLEVPSLIQPDWPLADDLDGVRRLIYVGHVGGMPNWGVGKLSDRQIDAVGFYILEQLRPEMLSDSVAIPGPLRPDTGTQGSAD